jgi:hypothetical protein
MSTAFEVSLTDGLSSEYVDLATLTDMAEEPSGGPLPAGWYRADVIEGYATRKGTQFLTQSAPSKNGESLNLRVCVTVHPRTGDSRNLNTTINYRANDFTPERITYVKEAREEFKGVQGAWSDKAAQASSLAIAKIGQLSAAIGETFIRQNGTSDAAKLVGKSVDIRLNINAKNYNDVTAWAPAGSKTGGLNTR